MKKWLIVFAIALVAPLAAHASTICPGSVCTASEVGPFMQGITAACGNMGECNLTDIEHVFANVGNWVIGIVGALVFLMYVYGGFMYLSNGVNPDGIKKGKQALRISTLGLIIVFSAYAGIKTLESTIIRGTITDEAAEFVLCGPGDVNVGLSCGYNSVCSDDGRCVTKCEAAHGKDILTVDGGMQEFYYACIDTNQSFDGGGFIKIEGCEQNLCPGPDEVQCCLVHVNNYNAPSRQP